MKKFLISVLCSILVFIGSPSFAMQGLPSSDYVAVFTGEEFNDEWVDKYEPDFKFIYHSWSEFPRFVQEAVRRAGTRHLVIDIDCHGNTEGYYVNTGRVRLHWEVNSGFFPSIEPIYEQASAGYIYSILESNIKNKKNTTVLLEACYAGNAYHTIRHNMKGAGKYMINYPWHPDIPVFCIGCAATNPDISMFFQYLSGDHWCWIDIRDYESKRPVLEPEVEVYEYLPHVSCTTLALMLFDSGFRLAGIFTI